MQLGSDGVDGDQRHQMALLEAILVLNLREKKGVRQESVV